MTTPIIPIALMGGALILLSTGKKKKRVKSNSKLPYEPIESFAIPEIYKTKILSSTSESTWIDRQKALQAISTINFVLEGRSVPLCTKCNPGKIDGIPGKDTRNAVKAFQALAGLQVDGEWGIEEDRAMQRVVYSIENGMPIRCDPLLGYPAPLDCFVYGDGFALLPGTKALEEFEREGSRSAPTQTPSNSSTQKYGPDELLVADANCEYILHQDDQWFNVQQQKIIEYALDGMTDAQAAREINESMLADYIPLCLSLGRDNVGAGVRKFWDGNAAYINSALQLYETLPDKLKEDAMKFGLL